MKKITIVSVVSFIFLFICSLVAKVIANIFTDFEDPLLIGVLMLAGSGVLAFVVRESVGINILCSVISAVAMGFILRSWYILRGLENSVFTMTLISVGAVVYLWIYFAIIRIPDIKESAGVTVAVTVIYIVISILIYVLLVLGTKTTFVSTVGFYAFLEISFIFAMSLEVNDGKELIRNLTLSTYSVFAVAIIVAVFALMAAAGDGDCDCDCGGCECADACDCCDGTGREARHTAKRKKRQFTNAAK